MTTVFADSFYWVAVFHPRDQWHQRAIAASAALGGAGILTTEEVLVEVVSLLTARGLAHRAAAVVRTILADVDVSVVEQSHTSFLGGLGFLEQRSDKGYSLTDCISMCMMREHSIFEVLTHDHHFRQEGFLTLLGDVS